MPRIQRKASSAQQSAHIHSQRRTFTADSAHSQPTAHFHSHQRTFTANSALSQPTAHVRSEQRTFTANSALSQPTAHIHSQQRTFTSNSAFICAGAAASLRKRMYEQKCRACLLCLHYFEFLIGNVAVAVCIDKLTNIRFLLDVEPCEAGDELAAVDAPLKLNSVRQEPAVKARGASVPPPTFKVIYTCSCCG